MLVDNIAKSQTFNAITSCDNNFWQQSKVRLQTKAAVEPILNITGKEGGHEFKAWGTCFNELDWDALNMLSRNEQEEIMSNIFSPNGDLRFTRGRLSMNANDYSRSWYSCSDVQGDFELRYFNIERDKRNIIPLMRAAMKYNPNMTFWMSPWSPPAWMKIMTILCVAVSTTSLIHALIICFLVMPVILLKMKWKWRDNKKESSRQNSLQRTL